ncbi:MAG: cupin domain-containing protein [Lentisphaerae bacterium]|nr:cupin domain-containing protein [Lentisphaerota bacterium]
MTIETHEDHLPADPSTGRRAGMLIDATQGAVNGYCMGTAYYDGTTYREPGVHDDQEGFYVLEGTGTAKVGGGEFRIRPGSAFIAAKGVPHTMKRDPESGPIKVLWSHGAV